MFAVVAMCFFVLNGTDHAAGNFNISVQCSATDGTADLTASVLVQVPFSLSPRKANKFLRQAMANVILAQDGLVIAPDDIYIPFSVTS